MNRVSPPLVSPAVDAAPQKVTPRAFGIGLALSAFLCAVTPYNNFAVGATMLGGNQFPVFALFALLLLLLANLPLKRFSPKRAFSAAEFITVWAMTTVCAGLPSSGMMRTFVPNIPAPAFYSNAVNDWQSKVWGKVSPLLLMHDPEAARAFFAGYPRGREFVPWAAWAAPLFFWGIFAAFFLWASFCVASLLRRQWVETERFVFPLAALPVMLAQSSGRDEGQTVKPLFKQPLFWLAGVGTFFFHGLRGLHGLYPNVPDVPQTWNLASFALGTPPFHQLGRFDASVYPLVIGLTYLLSTEVCFSLWFFYLVYKAEIVLGTAYNWDMPGSLAGFGEKQFHSLQAFGGILALVLWTLWVARAHLHSVWRSIENPSRAARADDGNEMLSYRATAWGLITSYAGMGLWEWAAGVAPPLIFLSLLMVTLALVFIPWAVCQAGMLFMAMPYATLDLVAATSGTGPFAPSALYVLHRAEGTFIYNTREMLIPSLLNGAKAAEQTQLSLRSLTYALAASVVLGVLVSGVASVWLPYTHGGGNSLANAWTYQTGPQIPLLAMGNAAARPFVGGPAGWAHIGGGFVFVASLLFLRVRFGFALHPIGFLGASVYGVHTTWFSLFLGWLLKVLLLRYGGLRGFRAALPFFMGLVAGDAVSGMIWIALGYLTGTAYNILPP